MLMSGVLLPACRSMPTVAETNGKHVTNSIRRDSVYLHDSTAVVYKLGESNNVLAHGLTAKSGQTGNAGPASAPCRVDTLLVRERHTRWRDRETVKTDTVTLTESKTQTVQVRYVPAFYKYCAAVAILVVLYWLVRLALYIKRHF